jgi:hypothetical protein
MDTSSIPIKKIKISDDEKRILTNYRENSINSTDNLETDDKELIPSPELIQKQ